MLLCSIVSNIGVFMTEKELDLYNAGYADALDRYIRLPNTKGNYI
jgi:hypothetical protein